MSYLLLSIYVNFCIHASKNSTFTRIGRKKKVYRVYTLFKGAKNGFSECIHIEAMCSKKILYYSNSKMNQVRAWQEVKGSDLCISAKYAQWGLHCRGSIERFRVFIQPLLQKPMWDSVKLILLRY